MARYLPESEPAATRRGDSASERKWGRPFGWPAVVLAIAAAALLPPLVEAQGDDAVKLEALIAEAVENNPAIAAARERWSAAGERPAQVSSLPDPMLSYRRWLSSVETRVGPQENVFMLSQRIPFPGKLDLKSRMAAEDAFAEGKRYEATVRDVVYKVSTAYYDLYRIDRSLRILDDYLVLLKDFSRIAEQRYATGRGIQANVLKSQVEISSILQRRLAFERMREGVVARVNALLGRSMETPLGVVAAIDTTRLDISGSALAEQALLEREELRMTEAMIRKSEFKEALARREFLPDFNVQGSYITIPRESSMFPDAGKDAFSLMVGVNLPIFRGRRRAAVDEARQMISANTLAYRNLENSVRSEIADLVFQIETTAKTLDLYEQGLLVQAESSLQSAISAYGTGNLDFLGLLDAERMLLQLKLAYVKEQSGYRKQIAALARAVGGDLPD